MLDLVAVASICNSLCCGAALDTLGSDCCIALVVIIERVIHSFLLIFLFTLGTGCTTLRGGCIGGGVGVAVGDLVSINLSNSYSLFLSLLLVTPVHTAIQLTIACMIFSAWVIVGLVMHL